MSNAVKRIISLDAFCLRQFDRSQAGRAGFIDFDPAKFEKRINDEYHLQSEKKGESALVNGYAPFCKHLFVKNFTAATDQVLEITPENEHLIRTGYFARTPNELAVLTRWFPKDSVEVTAPSKYLDIILYSREQIIKENAACGQVCSETCPWGIVSVKPQSTDIEQPMSPITMMRNALPLEEGGSGVPLQHDKYKESVEFWKNKALIQ